MQTKIDFIGGNTKRCLMAMALPMIVAMFLNMAYNLVDSLWIGNLLGETAYAALTNSTPIILILTSVAMGATNGISILLSQAIGSKNQKRVESLIATSFIIAIVFSLMITLVLEIFLPHILIALNTPAETYDMAYSYLSKSQPPLQVVVWVGPHKGQLHTRPKGRVSQALLLVRL